MSNQEVDFLDKIERGRVYADNMHNSGWGSIFDALFLEGVSKKTPLLNASAAGELVGGNIETVSKLMIEWGGKLAYDSLPTLLDKGITQFWKWDHGFISIQQYDKFDDYGIKVIGQDISLQVNTLDREFADKTIAFFDTAIKEETVTGNVYVMKRDTSGTTSFVKAGYAATPLIRDNYSPQILSQVDHLVADINDKHPCGRLSILYGEPGTGKTHLIRSLLGLSPDTMFVIIRPEMISHLTDPDTIQVLLAKPDRHGKPIVFILEDADSCLVSRGADNMANVSSILNTSDGILGAVLDLRIIASTNAKKIELDEAMLRDGRLCSHIHVDRLSKEHAQRRLEELCKDAVLPEEKEKGMGFLLPETKTKTYSLAQVYKAANAINKKKILA